MHAHIQNNRALKSKNGNYRQGHLKAAAFILCRVAIFMPLISIGAQKIRELELIFGIVKKRH